MTHPALRLLSPTLCLSLAACGSAHAPLEPAADAATEHRADATLAPDAAAASAPDAQVLADAAVALELPDAAAEDAGVPDDAFYDDADDANWAVRG